MLLRALMASADAWREQAKFWETKAAALTAEREQLIANIELRAKMVANAHAERDDAMRLAANIDKDRGRLVERTKELDAKLAALQPK